MFANLLEDAVNSTEDGYAAILMGFDGIPVDQYTSGNIDIETVGMEFSVLVKEVRKAADQLDAGETQELTVRTDKMWTVLRVVNDEYFIALTLGPNGNIGKARYLLRIMSPDLRKEL